MTPKDIKTINKQLNVSNRDNHSNKFLIEHGGKTVGDYQFLSMSKKNPENDIIAVTKSLRSQSANFPKGVIAFAKTKNGDYLIMGQYGISLWSTSTNQKKHLMISDVRLNGKVVARNVHDVRYLFEPFVQKLEAKPNQNPPSDQKIKFVENDLGLKFRSELKDYFKKYGHVGYNRIIFTGISGDDKQPSSLTDAVYEITESVSGGKYPKNMLPLVDMGDGLFVLYNNNTGESTYWEYGQDFDNESIFKTIEEAMFAALEHEYELDNL